MTVFVVFSYTSDPCSGSVDNVYFNEEDAEAYVEAKETEYLHYEIDRCIVLGKPQ